MPTKASLTTRTAKGSALTTSEMDGNLENLRDASVGIASDDSTTVDLQLGNTITVAGAGGASTAVSGQTVTVTQGTITITGDDSTGEALAGGEELKDCRFRRDHSSGRSCVDHHKPGDSIIIYHIHQQNIDHTYHCQSDHSIQWRPRTGTQWHR